MAMKPLKLKAQHWLIVSMALYILVMGFLSVMRHLSSKFGDPDFAIFDQGFYTALKYHLPFFNTFEGHSHFAQHNSPVFYLLLPFYALHPSVITLVILQTVALALGALPLFWIARERLGERAALIFALLYLLYHPLHGINYDQFNELSFAVAPLMFALWYFLKRRWLPFWLWIAVTLMCKEDAAFVVIFWGIYGLALALRERRTGAPGGNLAALTGNSLAMLAVAGSYLYLSLYVIIPHFNAVHSYLYFSDRYAALGSNFTQVLGAIFTRPLLVASIMLKPVKIFYFLEMFLPLAFLPFWAPGLLWMTIPTFGINMLSSFEAMVNTGSRYTAYIIPFIFVAGIMGVQKLLRSKPGPEAQGKALRTVLNVMLTLTLLSTLFLNCTPVRIGFKVPVITPHQKKILAVIRTIPPEASVSTQADILQHICHRMHAYSGYYENSDYIVVDETSKWYTEHARWNEKLPGILSGGQYRKIYDDEGIKIYKRK